MKKTYTAGMMAGLLLAAGVASAEMITGTVMSIDPQAQKLTLLRGDTNESVTIKVKDANALSNLQAGGNVTLDANPRLFGGWKAETVSASGNASANASSADRSYEADSRSSADGNNAERNDAARNDRQIEENNRQAEESEAERREMQAELRANANTGSSNPEFDASGQPNATADAAVEGNINI